MKKIMNLQDVSYCVRFNFHWALLLWLYYIMELNCLFP